MAELIVPSAWLGVRGEQGRCEGVFGNLHLAEPDSGPNGASARIWKRGSAEPNSIQIVFVLHVQMNAVTLASERGNITPNVVIAISSNMCRASGMGNADSPSSAKEPLPPLPFSGAIAGQEEEDGEGEGCVPASASRAAVVAVAVAARRGRRCQGQAELRPGRLGAEPTAL
ncbi:unnamed protein product [Miscanthus lutarioriparius]|uniref:Uncharacterized protein n=1 Tax=Miscanthus lutarioriparius TaxID=422564 RepID=A0A811S8D0_9POAL|nr:unnamed protein product [Miscanthus lutarioriparius]